MQYHYPPRSAEVLEARFQKFLREFAVYEADQNRQVAQDRFLDAYSLWLRHHSPVSYENLCQAIVVLRKLDANFQFPLPSGGEFDDA